MLEGLGFLILKSIVIKNLILPVYLKIIIEKHTAKNTKNAKNAIKKMFLDRNL
jgi:hypothetical protein